MIRSCLHVKNDFRLGGRKSTIHRRGPYERPLPGITERSAKVSEHQMWERECVSKKKKTISSRRRKKQHAKNRRERKMQKNRIRKSVNAVGTKKKIRIPPSSQKGKGGDSWTGCYENYSEKQ